MREWEKEEAGIRVTEVAVCDERGEKALGKPVGMYLTVEAASLAKKDDDYHREVSEELAGLLRGMLKEHGLETEKMGRPVRTLVVGLGNPEATPDALGPKVLEHLQATRHLELEYGADFCRKHGYPVLSGITPGVMAQTGMETADRTLRTSTGYGISGRMFRRFIPRHTMQNIRNSGTRRMGLMKPSATA